MRRTALPLGRGVAGLLCALLTGCQSVPARFLAVFGINKDPVVVSLVSAEQPASPDGRLGILTPLVNPFEAYGPWRAALAKDLGRPVALDLCFPVQIEPNLALGLCHLAILTPGEYARLPQRERFPVLAVPADERGRVARPALLVVAAASDLHAVEDLRGRTVAFGPAGDCRTHHAALALLAQHGLQPGDLSRELLPLPGSLKHMPNARAVAQTVINASSQAGFIDEAAWERLPPHSPRPDDPDRARLRVIARTCALPDRLIVCSPTLDEATRAKVCQALLGAVEHFPTALRPLRISGYQKPTAELLAACCRLAEPAPTRDGATPDSGNPPDQGAAPDSGAAPS